MPTLPYIPESAPFTAEQRAWLNGFLAGLLAQPFTGQPQPAAPAPEQPAGRPLLVMFGSQTGTAEGVAERLAAEAKGRGFAPRVAPLDDYEKVSFPDAEKVVIVSSTWGDGDPPDNAAAFWGWLSSDAAPRLEKLEFAVLGLGDRNYEDFCGASKKFDARLEALGAKRLVTRGECDVDFEATAQQWLATLWPSLGANTANGNGTTSSPPPPPARASTYGRQRPFPGRALRNLPLNGPGSGKDVRHHEISLDGSGLSYQVGDALGVVPRNCPELVESFLARLKATGQEEVSWDHAERPLRQVLLEHADVSRPGRKLLDWVAGQAPESELTMLLAPDNDALLKKWLWGRDVLDVLELLPKPPPVAELLPLLGKLAPRLYSIASSPKAHPGEVHLTVSTVRYESRGRVRKGVASTFLAERVPADGAVPVYVQTSNAFKLPSDPQRPVIMVGPGTGIAPFRAFLEEREAAGDPGPNWLFFGDQKRACDFLYEDQITAWVTGGHLKRLDLAFSRDQAAKIYVQHRMLEQAGDLWKWLEEGGHFYVCGDASRMAKDVDEALHKVVEKAGGKSSEEARAYVANLRSEKRYQRDVY